MRGHAFVLFLLGFLFNTQSGWGFTSQVDSISERLKVEASILARHPQLFDSKKGTKLHSLISMIAVAAKLKQELGKNVAKLDMDMVSAISAKATSEGSMSLEEVPALIAVLREILLYDEKEVIWNPFYALLKEARTFWLFKTKDKVPGQQQIPIGHIFILKVKAGIDGIKKEVPYVLEFEADGLSEAEIERTVQLICAHFGTEQILFPTQVKKAFKRFNKRIADFIYTEDPKVLPRLATPELPQGVAIIQKSQNYSRNMEDYTTENLNVARVVSVQTANPDELTPSVNTVPYALPESIEKASPLIRGVLAVEATRNIDEEKQMIQALKIATPGQVAAARSFLEASQGNLDLEDLFRIEQEFNLRPIEVIASMDTVA